MLFVEGKMSLSLEMSRLITFVWWPSFANWRATGVPSIPVAPSTSIVSGILSFDALVYAVSIVLASIRTRKLTPLCIFNGIPTYVHAYACIIST